MNEYLETALPIIEQEVRPTLQRAWEQTMGDGSVPPYTIYVWGSVVEPRGSEPNDIDLIVAYEGEHIGDDRQASIEGWVASEANTAVFDEVDILVRHADSAPRIISNGRVSEVYDVEQGVRRDPRDDFD